MGTSAAALVSADERPARLTTKSKPQQAGFAPQIPALKCPCVSPSLKHAAFFNKDLSSFAAHTLSPRWPSVIFLE